MDIPKLELEFIFQIRMELGIRQKIGMTPAGFNRGFVAAAGGVVSGPRLNGQVVPNSGGDWAMYRSDNSVQFSARYMLEADDGTQIYMQNAGYRHASPEVAARMEALEQVDPSEYYFRITPSFETPVGKHDWLTRTLIIGTAHRHAEHSVFSYYAVL